MQNEPAAMLVFDAVAGRLTLVAPEVAVGEPVLMIVAPNADVGAGALRVHILSDAYDKDAGAPTCARWVREGLARYVHQEKFPGILERLGLRLPSSDFQNKPGTMRSLVEKNLAGHRRDTGVRR